MTYHLRTMPRSTRKAASIGLSDIESDEEFEPVAGRGGTISKGEHNKVVKVANEWRQTKNHLRDYAKKLKARNKELTVALKFALEQAKEREDDSSAGTTKPKLNSALESLVRDLAKAIIWRSHQLIYSEKHAKDLTKKLLAYLSLPEDITEVEFVRDYSKTVKNAIADARQYCQSQLGKKTKGTSYFEVECMFRQAPSQILL